MLKKAVSKPEAQAHTEGDQRLAVPPSTHKGAGPTPSRAPCPGVRTWASTQCYSLPPPSDHSCYSSWPNQPHHWWFCSSYFPTLASVSSSVKWAGWTSWQLLTVSMNQDPSSHLAKNPSGGVESLPFLGQSGKHDGRSQATLRWVRLSD